VIAILYGGGVRRMFARLVIFLSKIKLKTDKEIIWASVGIFFCMRSIILRLY